MCTEFGAAFFVAVSHLAVVFGAHSGFCVRTRGMKRAKTLPAKGVWRIFQI